MAASIDLIDVRILFLGLLLFILNDALRPSQHFPDMLGRVHLG